MGSKQLMNIHQLFAEHKIKLPLDINNDLIYVQKALQAHIKIHDKVLDVFDIQKDADPAQKRRALEELEREMFEINADQHYLLLQTQRLVRAFQMRLEEAGYHVEIKELNAYIGSRIMLAVMDDKLKVRPITVPVRASEDKLHARYFEEVLLEIFDSDEERSDKKSAQKSIPTAHSSSLPPPSTTNNQFSSSKSKRKQPLVEKKLTPLYNSETLERTNSESLLKPISQRTEKRNTNDNGNTSNGGGEGFFDASKFLKVGLECDKKPPAISLKLERAARAASKEAAAPLENVVSKRNAMLRFNLRQALQNSTKGQTKSASTSPTHKSGKDVSNARKSCSPPNTTKKAESKNKSKRSTAVAFANSNNMPAPKVPKLNHEDSKGNVQIASKAEFLHMMRLCSVEDAARDLIMRRSKRMRRCVYNDNADFHYGDNVHSQKDQKGKQKAFLLSPQLKGKSQNQKRPNFNAIGNDADEVIIRNNMIPVAIVEPREMDVDEPTAADIDDPTVSDIDEPAGCNECFEEGGSLESCQTCNGFYHKSCHQSDSQIQSRNLCPACKRHKERIIKN